MCYNFLQLVGVSENNGVAYAEVMGTIKLDSLHWIGAVGDIFAQFFPLLILVVAIFVFFDIHGRILALCNVKRFAFEQKMTDETIAEGREILQRGKTIMQLLFIINTERRRRLNKLSLKNDEKTTNVLSTTERLKRYLERTKNKLSGSDSDTNSDPEMSEMRFGVDYF